MLFALGIVSLRFWWVENRPRMLKSMVKCEVGDYGGHFGIV